jgi:hypothetical protein
MSHDAKSIARRRQAEADRRFNEMHNAAVERNAADAAQKTEQRSGSEDASKDRQTPVDETK